MDNQEQLYKLFKDVADRAEKEPDFPSMEKIWIQVEERLDHKERKQVMFPFRKISVAAAVLILISCGIYFALNNSSTSINRTEEKLIIAHKGVESDMPFKYDSKGPDRVMPNERKNGEPELAKKHTKVQCKTFNSSKKNVMVVPTKVNREVRGIITDSDGYPVLGAEVKLKNGQITTFTDDEGKYAIEVPNGANTLVVEYIGFGMQEVVVPDSVTYANAALSKTESIEGIVVYGKKIDKRSYVGALTTVTADQIAKRPVTNVAKAIEGTAPGIVVTSGGGQPGASPDILMRGVGSISAANTPLIIVDGNPYTGSLTTIDPSAVSSMSFLKDATATAIYGSRGANGVIIITTKNPKKQSGISKAWHKFSNLFRKKQAITSYEQPIVPEQEIPVDNESYDSFEENAFESPVQSPLSTFSIDVDNASYTNIRRFINEGQVVPKDAVRIEEMINFFKYDYNQPQGDHPFAIHTEYSDAPWNKQHKLLKIGLQGKNIPIADLPASNLVFLIDVSGSMSQENKLPLLKSSLKLLTEQLRAQDKVAIVVYAGAAGVVLPSTSGDQKEEIIAALDRLSAGGSTAGGAGIELAYKLAKEHFIRDGNNRVILATDGDFNVGPSSDTDMQQLIEEKRKHNIFLTCLGYGMGNYKDSKMELLADKGNGNYAYIDDLKEADRFLVREFSGTLFSIAKDVKIQIEFNPQHVQAYRLIGYENRKLRDEDFTNDAIDAGELGSGHSVTALYEIIPAGVQSEYYHKQPALKYTQVEKVNIAGFNNELATVKFRYKKPDGDKSIEMVNMISDKSMNLQATSHGFKLATAVAWFGLKLRDSEFVPDMSKESILDWTSGIKADQAGYVQELIGLIQAAK